MLSEAAKAAKRNYQRQWQRKNRDRVRLYQVRYWTKRAAADQAAGDQDGAGKETEKPKEDN